MHDSSKTGLISDLLLVLSSSHIVYDLVCLCVHSIHTYTHAHMHTYAHAHVHTCRSVDSVGTASGQMRMDCVLTVER